MKLMIAGSRSIVEYVALGEKIPKDVTLIISGGADGVDALAEQYADMNNISKLIVRPNYKKYGKAAPLVRNREMVDIADKVLVIWDGESKGTKYTVDYAKKMCKLLEVISVKTT